MVINLASHGLSRRGRLAGNTLDDLVNYAKDTFSEVASDKNVKARVVSEAMKSVTGVAPIVDTRDPRVTWVRTVPAHGKFVDAVFMASAKKITSGPSAGREADLKIDAMPALKPFLLKRFLPVALITAGAVFAAGYFVGKD